MTNDYTQLTAIVAITIGFIELIKYLISRLTGNGSKGINDKINELRENHLHTLKETLDRIDSRTEKMAEALILIAERLKQR